MDGLGFLIYQLKDMPPVDELVWLITYYGIKWISIEVAIGEKLVNQIGGNDKIPLSYIQACQAAGVEVGGWQYVYTTRCGPQAAVASERIEKLGLQHLLVDAEGEFDKPGTGNEAELYMNSLDVNAKFPVGLCAYRFRSVHLNFPWGKFLQHEKMKFNAPQVYWLEAHNPAAQLTQSMSEFASYNQLFVPIGSTFGAGSWEPRVEDLSGFMNWCRNNKTYAYGFYSLDWIVKKKRWDWMKAITLKDPPVPPVPPMPKTVKVSAPRGVNVRGQAKIDPANIKFVAKLGMDFDVEELDGDFYQVKMYVHKDYVKGV